MITSNVVHRTFRLKLGSNTGTCFVIDRNERQYLVTARHVVEGFSDTKTVELFHDNRWKTLDLTLVGHCEGEVDISVLAAPLRLATALPLPVPSIYSIRTQN